MGYWDLWMFRRDVDLKLEAIRRLLALLRSPNICNGNGGAILGDDIFSRVPHRVVAGVKDLNWNIQNERLFQARRGGTGASPQRVP
jgi:hypothetical protein